MGGKSKLSFNASIALNLAYNKNKLYKTLDYCSRDMLNFDFLEKTLGIVSPSHFVYGFSRKMFLMSYSTNWSNFIVWLVLLLEILGNMYCNCLFPRLWRHKKIFLIKPFLCMTKKTSPKYKYLENENRRRKKNFSSF